ncbi:MAG: thioesterase family protein [Jhaorihella sp.]
MTDNPITGHDGPYPAPVEVGGCRVAPDWIDYNGHMNVGYYGIAFDRALDVVLSDHLGVGVEFVQAAGQGPYVVQSHLHFLAELLEGTGFCVRFRLLDHDAKRLHLFAEMVADDSGTTCATQELMVMNVDHGSGRSAPYPDWAQRRFSRMRADHAALPAAGQIGAPLGIRRRG